MEKSKLIELARWDNPAPQPPADGEVAWMYKGEPDFDGKKWRENWLVTLDRRLAEHGAKPDNPIPLFCAQIAPTPMPVTERLPGPEDCDAEGRCWIWTKAGAIWRWQLVYLQFIDLRHGEQTHWLPAHALPLPN